MYNEKQAPWLIDAKDYFRYCFFKFDNWSKIKTGFTVVRGRKVKIESVKRRTRTKMKRRGWKETRGREIKINRVINAMIGRGSGNVMIIRRELKIVIGSKMNRWTKQTRRTCLNVSFKASCPIRGCLTSKWCYISFDSWTWKWRSFIISQENSFPWCLSTNGSQKVRLWCGRIRTIKRIKTICRGSIRILFQN